jgi:hypothetical protein
MEQEPSRPVLQRVRTPGPHPALAALVVVAATAIVGVGVVGRVSQQQPAPSAQTVAPAPAAVAVSPSPGTSPRGTAPPTPRVADAPPIVAVGWPVTAVGPIWSQPTLAPNGTAYVVFEQGRVGRAQVVALDPDGNMRPGWPYRAAAGESLVGPSVGADGTVWVAAIPNAPGTPSRVIALSPSGSVRPGWPVEVSGLLSTVPPAPGPDGSAYVVRGDAHGSAQLAGFAGSGRALPCFPVALDRRGEISFNHRVLVSGDGAMFATATAVDGTGETLRVLAMRPAVGCARATLHMRGQSPGVAMLPDGRLLAWVFGISPRSLGVGPAVRSVRIAIIGPDGKVAAGWPRTVRGVTSAPAIGPDGAVYVIAGESCSAAAGRVVAFRPDGNAKPGWPAPLPAGFGGGWRFPQSGQACIATPPVAGPDGSVHALVGDPVSGGTAIATIDPNGRPRRGWPFELATTDPSPAISGIDAFGGALLPVVGPDGWVYQAISGPPGSVLAIDATGSVVARTPLPEGMAIAGLQAVQGRRLLVTAVLRSGGFPFVTIRVLGPFAPIAPS